MMVVLIFNNCKKSCLIMGINCFFKIKFNVLINKILVLYCVVKYLVILVIGFFFLLIFFFNFKIKFLIDLI